jgi:hypothetical protein
VHALLGSIVEPDASTVRLNVSTRRVLPSLPRRDNARTIACVAAAAALPPLRVLAKGSHCEQLQRKERDEHPLPHGDELWCFAVGWNVHYRWRHNYATLLKRQDRCDVARVQLLVGLLKGLVARRMEMQSCLGSRLLALALRPNTKWHSPRDECLSWFDCGRCSLYCGQTRLLNGGGKMNPLILFGRGTRELPIIAGVVLAETPLWWRPNIICRREGSPAAQSKY